jgi:DNA/RNA endonuclease G (NUC1)
MTRRTTAMKRAALFAVAVCLAFVGTSAFAATTYTWNGGATASYALSTSWTPNRTTPAVDDILLFNNGVTTIVTGIPATQTIGQLAVSGNTNVTLQAPATATLTISGGGTGLSVAAGSQLNINTAIALTINLPSGTSGNISGSMNLSQGAHRLTAVSASPITFQSGSTFTEGTSFSGNPFGTANLNSIIFASGSTFVFTASSGGNPFGATAPSSVVNFQTGSLYSHQSNATPSFSNRTYADVELKTAGTVNVTGGTAVTLDNLTITQGTFGFNMTTVSPAPAHTIKGNVSIVSGATLTFNPATAATVNIKGNIINAGTLAFAPTVTGNEILNGSSAQSISNSGTLTVGNANETITISNANGVSLLTPVTINNGILALTTGNVSATGANVLSIGSAATVTRSTGYVLGNLKKTIAATGSKTFEVGTANGYSPVIANVTSGTGDITVAATQGPQPNMVASTSLQRYWTLTATGITADLTFQYLAGDVLGNENIYKVFRKNGGTPLSFPGSVVNTAAHTGFLAGVSTLSDDWTVGEAPDTTPPAVSSVTVPANGTYVAGQNLDFTVNFSEVVNVTTGGGTPRIPITLNTGGTVYANYVSGSGSLALLFRYPVVTGNDDPDGITVGSAFEANGGTIKDAAGNDALTTLNGVGSTTGVKVDAIAPSVSTSSIPANGTYVAPQNLSFTVTYSEAVVVTGVPYVGVTLNTGGAVQAGYVSGSGTATITFRYTVVAGNEDTDGITVAPSITLNAGTIKDAAGNDAATAVTFASTAGVLVDAIAPSSSSSTVPASGTYSAGQTLNYSVTFTEPVFVIGTPVVPVTLNSGSVQASYVSGSGTATLQFQYTIASGDADNDGVTTGSSILLNGGSIKDAAGNNAATAVSFASTAGVLADGVAPTVSASVRADADPTTAATVHYTVTFSEDVSGVTTGAFQLTAGGGASGTISGVVPVDAHTYTVTVSSASGEGTLRLDVKASGTGITDIPGNPLSGGFTTGQFYTLDHVGPNVTSVAVPANSTYTVGQNMDFTVNFNENAFVAGGTPRIALTLNSGSVYANYVSGSGGTALLFRYTVVTGDSDPDGIAVGSVIDLNGATIRDSLGNDAVPALNSVGSTTGVLVDANAPSVVSVVRTDPNPNRNSTVNYSVTFSQSVTGVDASDFALTTTGVTSPSITGVTGSGSSYTVSVGTGTGDGTIRLDVVNNGSIVSSTNNAPLGSAFTAGEVYNIDKTAPVVQSIVRANGDPTAAATVNFTVTYSEPVSGVSAQDWALTTTVSGASVTGFSGSGTTYNVAVNSGSGDGTIRLDVVTGGTVIDAAGNLLAAGFTSGQLYTIDKTAPSVSSIARIGAATTNAASVQFTVTFSEPVLNVGSADFTATTTGLTGASVTGVSGSGPYVVTVNTGSGDGTVQLDVNAGTATINDAAGNALTASFTIGDSDTIDKTVPAVQSIVKASADPTTATSVNFTVTFTESVTGVDATDFTITAPALTSTSISNVTGSGASYTVTVGTGSGSGSLRLDFTGNGSVLDAAGNSAATFTGGESYTIQGLPAAPTGLVATAGNAHVALSWNAVSGATSYNVKRSLTTGSGFSTINNVAAASYDDTSVTNGTAYFYKVSAINGRGEGSDSAEATATPAAGPAAPSPVSIAVGDAKVILSWPSVAGATSYTVKRGTVSGTYPVTNSAGAALTYTDSTVTNGTAYFYVVTATSTVEGDPSAEVSGTPNTPSVLGVVISQVYGGGGNAGATLKNDFVELFNRGTQTVSLNGWFVHYSSSGATTWNSPAGASTTPTALAGTIAPGRYYLVQEAAGANGAAASLPAPDATGTIAMSGTAAKIALTDTATIAVQCPSGGSVADFVGYGGANCSETSPTAVLSNTTAALRKTNGCTDTNNNSADFTVVTQPLTPRNSGSPINVCGAAVNNPPSITPPADPIASVAQDSAPFTVNLSGNDDGGVYAWSATPGSGIQNVTVSAGQSTGNVTYTVTLVSGFNGTATFTAMLSDGITPATNQTVHVQVTAAGGNNPPVITPPANPITTVAQDPPPFTVNVSGSDDGGIFNWSATPGTGVASVNVTAGQGTNSVTYTVALNAGFNGTATFTASLSDNVNPLVNQLVNINVLSAGATPNHVVISQLYGGGGNSGATFTNDFVELYNPTASPVNMGGWSVQYSPATSTGTFTGLQPIGGTIGPGEYFLISLASGGANGSALPAANIVANSGFNMSGTAGKVALVSTGTPVPGPCAATAADTDIVDLVGYGSTANCNEGGTNAPAPSNSTADFRKNGGNTDTNVNGNDFVTGTPNPRRTSPIQEIGPSVVNTDPTTNGINAPRDASVIVTFSELVDVTAGWYNINCSSSGVHNDATVVEGAPNTWVITPNSNFSPAEQCSVTLFKDFVHDRDTDDSVPGTDTLAADYTWTFTVSTGTAPPYPSSVHLTMGNPSNATASLSNPNNYLMQKPEMAISYSRDLGRPNWVSWHLTDEWIGSLTRVDTFRPDPEVPPTWYRVLGSDFFASGFDRGHMTPNADRDKETSIPINQATFLMSNMVAQAPGNNQGPWAALESYLRTLLPADEIYIVSGPAGTGGTGSNGGVTNTIANGHVTVPASTWKCTLVLPKASGDDVARVTASTRTVCVIMPNLDSIRTDDWHIYLKSVDQVEALTGYDLFSNVPAAVQNAIEGGVDGANPPGTANQSASTNEDIAKSITLDAVSPAGALTYTILTGPFHGGLTGSGANRTYTPAPDFNGTDTFTWRVNDGTNNSNTSTMTITVAEVNDPPAASDDSKSTTANNAITFPSSDLTANDSRGPANEASQSLNVTTVTPTVNTHGTVTLTSGQITYTPAAGYAGPASFTYTVCDNGTTAGSLDALCTTGTVNVTINPQVTTHFSLSAPPTANNGSPFNVTVTALDASNATVTSYTGTVHITSSSAGTLPADYTFVGADSGIHTFSVTLTSAGSQSITATDGGITGSTNTTVGPPPATHFSVTAPANVTSGVAFNVTVTALDASNTIVPSYTGTVHFTSSSAGSLPADYTFVAGDNGAHTFSVTLTSTGAQSITATNGPITGSANTTVAPPPATHFSVSAPANVTSGVAFNVTVTALNASNTIVTSYTGTVHFTSSSAGSLPADYTFVAGDNGAHTFSVTLTSTGAQSITAADGAITGTANTTVAPPPATHFSVTTPGSVAAAIPFNVTVTALNASNATATAYAGTVHFTSSSAGTLPADYTFVAADNGVHTFAVTLVSAGSQTLTATDTVAASITGSASITVGVLCPPGPVPTATASNSGPACAGSTVNLFAGGNGSIFSWTGPGGFTSSQQNPTGITVAGSYTVTVSSPGVCGGSAQASTTVVFNPIPSAAITTPATVCAVAAGNTASVPNAGAGAAYGWSITNGNITGGNGTASISYTAGSSGNVHLAVTVTSNSCSVNGTFDVAIAPRPTITLPASIAASCGASSVNVPFTLTGTGPWSVLWSDGITQTGITAVSSSRNVSITGSVVLSAIVSDANCSNGSASVSIVVSSAPVITTQPVGQIVQPSQKATFTVTATGANLHYQWFVKHANGATVAVGTDSPSYTTIAEGNATWFVRVTNPCGSLDSDRVIAMVVTPRHPAATH